MKTEQEVKQEIKNCETTIDNYSRAYENGKVPNEIFKQVKEEYKAIILTLKWVLGENDRYD